MVKKRVVPLVVLAFLIAGAGFFWHIRTMQDRDEAREIILYGNVDIRQIQLAFHATGRIRQLLVQEGDHVKSGELVAEVDPLRYEASVARAAAEVAARKQTLARLLAGSRPEQIREAQARVKAAEAKWEDAKLVYERTERLFRDKTVPKQKLDDAQAARESARADLDADRQALTLAIKGPREEDIAAARAQVKASEAALRLAERELADTKLYAPTAGVIQDRILEPGDMAFPETPVFTLALSNPVWVRAYVSEPDLGKVAPGMKAYVTTDSFPGKVYRGWIGFISPTAEFTPKEVQTSELRTKLVYRIRVYACNPENELRLGMPVTLKIPLDQPKESTVFGHSDPCEEEHDAAP
ncbi:MAG: efflux RND transporter periplasmic adaptor subunit [Deltaproteobacteria bacterium]|jgi:HlyD family secretion protein